MTSEHEPDLDPAPEGDLDAARERDLDAARERDLDPTPEGVLNPAREHGLDHRYDLVAEPKPEIEPPSLADQVTRLYDYIGGYHATQLIEIARDLGAWEAITRNPGISSSDLASRLETDSYYTDILCRTAFALELLDRDGQGWRMAPHFDAILGDPDSTFYLGRAARIHLVLGADYPSYPDRFRHGRVVSFQDHGDEFITEIADGLVTLPKIFVELILPTLPALSARLEDEARVLDLGCGAGWALIHLAQRFPRSRFVGVDLEPHSIALAQNRIAEHGLSNRCEARLVAGEELGEENAYDVVTSFLVVHEVAPAAKDGVFASVARSLVPGGAFVIFDEVYPETDRELRSMPARFAAVAQWFELTWGNRIDTLTGLEGRCARVGLEITEQTTFSRFSVLVATKSRARDPIS